MHEPPEGRPPRDRATRPGPPVRLPERGEDVDLTAYLAAQQAALSAQLDDGLAGIQASTERLVRKIAAEVWKATTQTSAKAGPLKDGAARSILAYVDERYQQLSLSVSKLDETVEKLARATSEVVIRLNRSGEIVDRQAEALTAQSNANQQALRQLAARIDRSMQPVTARLDAIEKAMQAAVARQRADLAAFTERASEGLGRVGQRLRDGFVAIQRQTSEENQGLVEQIRVAVSREIERVERLADEQAAQSAAVAERIARAVRDVTERTTSTVGTLRDTFDERIDEVTRETQEAMAEASAQLAARQRAMLDAALRGLERKQRDLRLVEDPMPQPPAPPIPEPPMPEPEPTPPPVPEPPAADRYITIPEAEDVVPFDEGFDDLQTSIEGLGDLDLDDE